MNVREYYATTFLNSDVQVKRGAPPLFPLMKIPAGTLREGNKFNKVKFWWSNNASGAHRFVDRQEAGNLILDLEPAMMRGEICIIHETFFII